MIPKLYTVKEAAALLRTTPEALQKRMERLQINHVHEPGRGRFMTERQIEDHIEKCTIISQGHPPG